MRSEEATSRMERDIVERLHEAWREPLERLERDGLDFEAATEITRLRSQFAEALKALQEIYDHDDGAWAAGEHEEAAKAQGRRTIRAIAGEALRKLEDLYG